MWKKWYYLYLAEHTGGSNLEITIHRFLKSDLSYVDNLVLTDGEFLNILGMLYKDNTLYLSTNIKRTLQGVASQSIEKIYVIDTTTFTETSSKAICLVGGVYCACSGTAPDRYYQAFGFHPVVDSDGNIYVDELQRNYAAGWSSGDYGVLKINPDFTTAPTFVSSNLPHKHLAINDDYLFTVPNNNVNMSQITLSSFTVTDTLVLSSGGNALAIDNTHAYILNTFGNDKVMKVELDGLNEVALSGSTPGSAINSDLVYEPYLQALYVTGGTGQFRILISDFENIFDQATGGTTMGKIFGLTVADGIYLYVGGKTGANNIIIKKYVIGTQAIVDAGDVEAEEIPASVLLGMTYLREQDVVAWHRHVTDGDFESVAVIPGETQDDVWVIVKREIDGSTVRYVERLDPLFDDDELDIEDAFFVDCGKTYTGPPSKTVIDGLDHIEGEAVDVLADGLVVTGHTVASNKITLTTAASKVHVGLNYTGQLQPMRLEAGADEGTAQGRIKRINNMVIRFFETLFGNLGPDSSTLDSMDGEFTAGTLLSGDVEWPFNGDYGLGGDILFTHNKPTPCTIICMIPEVRTAAGMK